MENAVTAHRYKMCSRCLPVFKSTFQISPYLTRDVCNNLCRQCVVSQAHVKQLTCLVDISLQNEAPQQTSNTYSQTHELQLVSNLTLSSDRL